jgi:hypothetical protein
VECWGNDDFDKSSPPSGTFDSVTTGAEHACGLTTSGSVKCWGNDYAGVSTPPDLCLRGSSDDCPAGTCDDVLLDYGDDATDEVYWFEASGDASKTYKARCIFEGTEGPDRKAWMQVITTDSTHLTFGSSMDMWRQTCDPGDDAPRPAGAAALAQEEWNGAGFLDWGVNYGVCSVEVHQIEICPYILDSGTAFQCYRSQYSEAPLGTLQHRWNWTGFITDIPTLYHNAPVPGDALFIDHCGFGTDGGEHSWSSANWNAGVGTPRVGIVMVGTGATYTLGVGLAWGADMVSSGLFIAKAGGGDFSCPIDWSVRIR